VFLFQLAAFGQENQLGRRFTFAADSVGQRDERLHRRRNVAEGHHQVALRVFDAFADNALLSRLEQLPLANVLQVDTDEVDLFAADGRPGFELFFFVGFDGLVFEGLGLLLVENLLGAGRERLTGVLQLVVGLDRQPEFLGAMAPVQDVRLLGRIAPVDERLPPRRRRVELERFGASPR
jgi:hypothetical protein